MRKRSLEPSEVFISAKVFTASLTAPPVLAKSSLCGGWEGVYGRLSKGLVFTWRPAEARANQKQGFIEVGLGPGFYWDVHAASWSHESLWQRTDIPGLKQARGGHQKPY